MGHARVVACGEVPLSLFDIWFNGLHDYRAVYHRSRERDVEANAFFLRTL